MSNYYENSFQRAICRAARLFIVIGLAGSAVCQTAAQTSDPLVIDASAPLAQPNAADYEFNAEDAISKDGHKLGLNADYLTRDGKPWLPVMGEMHYTRVPAEEWEEQILKMKSAGVQIIAAYIIWNHHEEIEGQWDWSGGKDLRRFAQLCAKHDMYFFPRIGPWSHAEVRNGGFPDWLVKSTPHPRTNDPVYLGYADSFYKEIGKQLEGLMWKDGGPVIGVQIENEYRGRSPKLGAEHVLTLKQMARRAGLQVPYYTLTGWDGAAIPVGSVLPVYGGYPDAAWEASIKTLPPAEVYAFRFGSRVTGNMGAQNGEQKRGPIATEAHTPFLMAEMGGGMQLTYSRRAVISPDDIVAMMPVMLGSGVNMYGTYMFQGGENPDGKLTTLQESLDTGAPNELPVKTYDFFAPLGEFGDERPSLMKMKSWNYFLNDFGSELAPMAVRRPEVLPAGPGDLSVPRVSIRSSGEHGFLFVNNHVRNHPMAMRPNFQVQVRLPKNQTLSFPDKPISLPADSYFIWPFHKELSGLDLRYATAQLMAKVGSDKSPIYVFFAQPGISPEFVIEDAPGLKLDHVGNIEHRDHAFWVRGLTPGLNMRLVCRLPNGNHVTFLVLRQEDAEKAWRIKKGHDSALLITPQQVFVDGDTVTLENMGTRSFETRVVPTGGLKLAADRTVAPPGSRNGSQELPILQVRKESEVAPLPVGFKPSSKPRVVAAAPTDADWQRAGIWSVKLPNALPEPNTKAFLRIDYFGDVARLYAGERLLADDFWHGRPWLVGLDRFLGNVSNHELRLAIYPLRRDPPIFFEPGTQLPFEGSQGLAVRSIEIITEYKKTLRVLADTQGMRP